MVKGTLAWVGVSLLSLTAYVVAPPARADDPPRGHAPQARPDPRQQGNRPGAGAPVRPPGATGGGPGAPVGQGGPGASLRPGGPSGQGGPNASARPGGPGGAGRPGGQFAPGGPARPGGPGGQFGPGGRPAFDGRGQVLDGRYNHGRYYPPLGAMRPSLPPDYRPYFRGNDRYYFDGGIWYAPRGPGFVVVRPPPGLVITVLPPYYSTVWFGGNPYYYADNVYYAWQPDVNGYAVVDPPDDADQPSDPPQESPQSAPDDLIVYPKNGQTKDQQAADQFECHAWARGQTGFDPTQEGGGVAPADADRTRSNYNRAMSACLQGRGYQVN